MASIPNIRLPNFVLPTFYRLHCPKCDVQIGEDHVVSAGISRTQDGILCFSYEYGCPRCHQLRMVQHLTHPFTNRNWWDEISQWHDAAIPATQLAKDSKIARRTMPKVGPMILDMAGLESAWIRGGYMGDVGPVMLLYDGTEPNSNTGVMRLERNGKVRLYNHGDPHCLPRLDLGRFAAVVEGGTFPLDGRMWRKLSVTEIEKIICDRVFTLCLEGDDLVPTPKPKIRRRHDTHASKSRKGNRRSSRDSRSLDS